MGTFPCTETVDLMPTVFLTPPGQSGDVGDSWSWNVQCIGGDPFTNSVLERSNDGGNTWIPTPFSGTITAADAALSPILFRAICTDNDGDQSVATGTLTVESDLCDPAVVATNPSSVCGTSPDWETSLSPTGPWAPAFDNNQTCGQGTANPTIPGAGWISANNAAEPVGQVRYYRTTFTLTASQAAGFDAATIEMSGDSSINDVLINGVDVYNGTPPNNFNLSSGVFSIPVGWAQTGTNEIIIAHDADSFVWDGIAFVLRAECTDQSLQVDAGPPDQSIPVGNTATITGSATGGTPPYTNHRWEVTDAGPTAASGTVIPGETVTTLDVEAQ